MNPLKKTGTGLSTVNWTSNVPSLSELGPQCPDQSWSSRS